MKIGESKVTNLVLSMIGEEMMHEVDNYVNEICSKDIMVMSSEEQIKKIFSNAINDFVCTLTEEEKMALRNYTGYNFRNINAILRDNWSYEVNGMLTSEKRMELRELSYQINSILSKFKMPDINLVTFRGTTIDAFSSYGIKEISDLENLEGKFMYEQGFTSTSLLEDTSYFNKTLEDGKFYNIGIRYIISSDCEDVAFLADYDLSYSHNQNEFLLSSSSLSKVIDVKVDEVNNTAVLTVVFVPKKVYDLGYNKDKNGSRNVS